MTPRTRHTYRTATYVLPVERKAGIGMLRRKRSTMAVEVQARRRLCRLQLGHHPVRDDPGLIDQIIQAQLDEIRASREQGQDPSQQKEHSDQHHRNQADEDVREDQPSTHPP